MIDNYCGKLKGGKYLCCANVEQEYLCEGYMQTTVSGLCIFKAYEKDNLTHCHSIKAIRLLEESFNGHN